jgi:hypothetical protein
MAEGHYAECCYAECHYSECRYAECRGTLLNAAYESCGEVQSHE